MNFGPAQKKKKDSEKTPADTPYKRLLMKIFRRSCPQSINSKS